AVVLVWGTTWAAIKIGVDEVPPFIFAFARALAVASLLTLAAIAFRQRFPRTRRMLAVAVAVGLINTGWSWAIIFWAERFVPSGLVSVFGASAPGGTAFLVLAPLALLEAGEPQRWTAGSVLAFAYLVVFGTCFGMVVSLWLYRKLRPTTITLVQVIVPAEAILIGTFALGESVSARMLGG